MIQSKAGFMDMKNDLHWAFQSPDLNHIIIEVIVLFCYFLPVLDVKLSFFLHIYTYTHLPAFYSPGVFVLEAPIGIIPIFNFTANQK